MSRESEKFRGNIRVRYSWSKLFCVWTWAKWRFPNGPDGPPPVCIGEGVTATKIGARWAAWRAGR